MYPPLAVLIDRAVRMKREERWPNARAMLAELETIIPVSSEIRALTPTVQANEAAMSTAPSSLMSWSHAVTWLRRGELRFRRRLAGIALGAVTAAAGVALFWAREPAPPPSDDAASGSRLGGALQPESSGASLLPSPSKAPTVPSPEAAHPRNDPTPPKRPLTQQAARPTHVASKPKVAAPVGAPVEKNEPGLSVPDEVLDRRE
jgi:hypothetical protein